MPSIDENTFHWVVGIMCSIIGTLMIALGVMLMNTINELKIGLVMHQAQMLVVENRLEAIAARQQMVIETLQRRRKPLDLVPPLLTEPPRP